MTIQDLITILKYARVDPHQKVVIHVDHSGECDEICDILSYTTHTDGIMLNIVVSTLEEEDEGKNNG